MIRLSARRPFVLFCWYIASLLFLLMIPARLRLGVAFWFLPGVDTVQVWAWVATFFAFALFLRVARSDNGSVNLRSVLLGLVLTWGAGLALLLLNPSVPHSRSVALICGFAGTLLAIAPYFVGDRPLGGGALALTAAAAVVGFENARPVEPVPVPPSFATARYQLAARYQEGVVGKPEAPGGGIERLGDGLLLVTGAGEFFRLSFQGDDRHLAAERLGITAPLGLAEYRADMTATAGPQWIRVTDLLIDSLSVPARIFVSHQHWDSRDHCLTMQISALPLADVLKPANPAPQWQTVFTTQPCLALTAGYDPYETGGRLVMRDREHLLFTVGDHGFDGLHGPPPAQDPAGDYGKILLVSLDGSRTIYSMGHRNPQGLVFDQSGRLWETEHGPQGGDEINVIEPGGNYGWPLTTYGTQYGLDFWPGIDSAAAQKGFVAPTFAFVPSIGITSLVQLGDSEFPRWSGDFLIASLSGKRLLRVHTEGERVVYVEPIAINLRIRDLVQAHDGTIVLWNDAGALTTLRVDDRPTGEALFAAKCSICHGVDLRGTRMAPALVGVVHRSVASEKDFSYSQALRKLGGAWSNPRLNDFLEAPDQFVPGTSMKLAGVASAYERSALIEFLRTRK